MTYNTQIFEARIRLDLVKLLARRGSKQKFDGPRLARLEKLMALAQPGLEKTGSTQPYKLGKNVKFTGSYICGSSRCSCSACGCCCGHSGCSGSGCNS